MESLDGLDAALEQGDWDGPFYFDPERTPSYTPRSDCSPCSSPASERSDNITDNEADQVLAPVLPQEHVADPLDIALGLDPNSMSETISASDNDEAFISDVVPYAPESCSESADPLDALDAAMAQARQLPAKQGFDKNSKSFGKWLVERRVNKRLKNRMVQAEEGLSGVADVVNRTRLRCGDLLDVEDKAQPPEGKEKSWWKNNNTWISKGALREAYLCIGRREQAAVRITHRTLDLCCLVSSAQHFALRTAVQDFFDGYLNGNMLEWMHFQRQHDSTPMFLNFGRLAGLLKGAARYWKDGKLVKYEDVVDLRKRIDGGVVEVFFGRGQLAFQVAGEVGSQRRPIICQPRILQSARAGVVLEAAGTILPEFDVDRLQDLSRKIGLIGLVDGADSAKSNLRAFAYTCTRLPDNVLYHRQRCDGHQFSRIAKQAMEAQSLKRLGKKMQLNGTSYAVSFVLTLTSKEEQIMRALRGHLNEPSNLLIHYRDAPAEAARQAETILSFTLRRRFDHTRGSLNKMDPAMACLGEDETLEQECDALASVNNGPWNLPYFQHFCKGPSCCPTGRRSTIIRFESALASTCLKACSQLPTVDRWLSHGEALGQVGAGVLCNRIVPQVFEKAFGVNYSTNIDAEDADDVDEQSSWHTHVGVKVTRAMDITNPVTQLCVGVFALVSTVLDWFLCRAMHLDQQGALLFDIMHTTVSPIHEAVFRLCRLFKPTSKGLSVILEYFGNDGVRCEREMLLTVLGQFKIRMLCFYDSMPFKMLAWLDPRNHLRKTSMVTEFIQSPPCCLDPYVARKLQSWCRKDKTLEQAIALCGGDLVSTFLKSFFKELHLLNMHIEGDLSRIKQSVAWNRRLQGTRYFG